MTSRALEADHERIAVAARTPYFHVFDSAMELQGHQAPFAWSTREQNASVERRDGSMGGLWRVELSVDCNVPAPSYFTRDGIIILEKREGQDWEPQSFFAKLIATYAPGSWFKLADPKDQEAFEADRKVLSK
ncbi:hypothetical protein ACVIW2_000125 [Bradyrhizobium huanghuaihaiense]|uniref:hypothetical protein n=1 Tax=Bradyrhizobium elkanii TaxID=29448 RepID=UPI0012F6D7EA|nr:hypothetical protein [Bradyrhizobium elkanii]MBP2435042.1 hypothetical protein [Bradyrhizobium elkanii]MCP1737780.1 hypothetical protein [Bradyrhizobium elkanii]MCS3575939.1 hypothetical protein [Bradyrhizobium elkanii]MCS3594723.1 hypothetical protein [Bradyrhizobium elkanii]MCS3625917.1 hypothetical protein [Bradyrhizobium elkanii]